MTGGKVAEKEWEGSARENKEYKEGYDAYQRNKSQKDCPYPVGSAKAVDWRKGYLGHVENSSFSNGVVRATQVVNSKLQAAGVRVRVENSWHLQTEDDIKACAKELGVSVTPQQVSKVLAEIKKGSGDDILIPIITGKAW